MELRGPFAFAIVRGGEGWPMSNLHRDGCKHDVMEFGIEMLAAGTPWPCSKCGCLLIPWPVFRDAATAFIRDWSGDGEVINETIGRE